MKSLFSRAAIYSGCLLPLLAGHAQPTRAADLPISIEIDAVRLIELFTANSFERPQVTWNETQTTFNLSIIGKQVESNGSFSTGFAGDFWRGNLSFSQSDPVIGQDRLAVGGDVFHRRPASIPDIPHKGDGEFGDTFTYTRSILASDRQRTILKVIRPQVLEHPSIPHFDSYRGLLQAESADNEIDAWIFKLVGKHLGQPQLLGASFRAGRLDTVDFKAAYPDGTTQDVGGPVTVVPGDVKRIALPANRGLFPNQYSIITAGGGRRTETTLAFLGGTEDDELAIRQLELLDLSLATQLYVGSEEFLAPHLFSQSSDLFIAIDLAEWLSFPTPFDAFDTFDFVAGKSELLPGVFASTSPFSFDPLQGFVTAPGSLVTGPLQIVGTIDGHAVAEPSTLKLLALGVLGLVFYGRRRRMRTRHATLERAASLILRLPRHALWRRDRKLHRVFEPLQLLRRIDVAESLRLIVERNFHYVQG